MSDHFFLHSLTDPFHSFSPLFYQVVLILSTWQWTPMQLVSLCISIFSLSWGSARLSLFSTVLQPTHRSYLILRERHQSDPDPKIAAVAFHIFPLMFLATLSHQILLVISSGLLGALVFPALALFIGLNYLILRCICKEEDMVVDIKTEADSRAGTLGENESDDHQIRGQQYFFFKMTKILNHLLILKTFTQVLTKRRPKMTMSPSSYKLHLVLPSFPLW